MPELPDVTVYLERLQALIGGQRLERTRVANVFVLRSYDPPISALEGKRAIVFRRLGGHESWLTVMKECPVSPDDVPPRRRAPAKRRKL